MSDIILNETPIKTTNGFNINNIKLSNIKFPEKLEEFRNVDIVCDTNKINVLNENSDYVVNYGVCPSMIFKAKENPNSKIKLDINSYEEENVQINYLFDNKNSSLVSNIEIVANENTKSNIIIRYDATDILEGYNNLLLKVIAKKSSKVKITIVNNLNFNTNNFVSIDNELYEASNVDYTIVDFGGKNSVTNYYSKLIGKDSKNKISTIYLGSSSQVFDLNYIGELYGKNSSIDIKVEGALKENSKKHFKGTIDFKKGCKKSIGNENESCMLLSDTAKSISLPMLLCTEEDVIGNHSSSAGKISEKELFYIMSRGFSFKEALKLMVRAKFNIVLKNIKDEALKKEILENIDRKLN